VSWDFSMEAPPCPTCGHRKSDYDADSDEGRLEANYTHNVAPMFREAFGLSVDGGIRGLSGMLGAKAEPLLSAALKAMRAGTDKYLAMEPENGWGSFAGAIRLLEKLAYWCRLHPDWTLRVA